MLAFCCVSDTVLIKDDATVEQALCDAFYCFALCLFFRALSWDTRVPTVSDEPGRINGVALSRFIASPQHSGSDATYIYRST